MKKEIIDSGESNIHEDVLCRSESLHGGILKGCISWTPRPGFSYKATELQELVNGQP